MAHIVSAIVIFYDREGHLCSLLPLSSGLFVALVDPCLHSPSPLLFCRCCFATRSVASVPVDADNLNVNRYIVVLIWFVKVGASCASTAANSWRTARTSTAAHALL